MAQADHPAQPRSMTLMAGPIDCRINPTKVNELAVGKPIEWFEDNLISRVPWRYPGALRRVYPGFLQLTAFMSMNLDRHKQAFRDLYRQLHRGEHEAADATKRFYDEYFAVNDLPAEFYLETVAQVFQQFKLAKGEFTVRGQRVEPAAIRRTALFTVEGERDDICSIGQTRGGTRPVHRHPALHEEPPRSGRRGPLRRVQRPALADADLPARARDDPRHALKTAPGPRDAGPDGAQLLLRRRAALRIAANVVREVITSASSLR